jgi:hypothetical protein
MATIDLLDQRKRMTMASRGWGVGALLVTLLVCLSSLAEAEPHVRGGDSLSNGERGSSGTEKRQAHRAIQSDVLIQGDLLSCSDNLKAADADGNSIVDRFEFTEYIALQSAERIDSPFMFLPLQFIAIFYSESCTTCYEETNVPDCCVGDKAGIDVSDSDPERYYSTLVYVCISTDQQLDELQLPSVAPATVVPGTVAPTPAVPGTVAPATTPPGTTSPATPIASDAPSDSPIAAATAAPTVGLTIAPTTSPTGAPSDSPSVGLTTAPTPIVTPIPSPSPTLSGTATPGTAAPSAMPSSADLVCVDFSFLLNNDIGLSAEDLLNEVNNTLKTGLEIAGANITIEIMNASFPGGDVPEDTEVTLPGAEDEVGNATGTGNVTRHALERPSVASSQSGHIEGAHVVADAGHLMALQAGLTGEFGQDKTTDILRSFGRILRPRPSPSLHRQQRYPGNQDLRRSLRMSSLRRLVYYTDEFPSTVYNIRQNFICDGAQEGVLCSVVEQFTCVVLEEGDDRAVVQAVLSAGIREAINNGDFEKAIPPEHIP